MGIRRCRATVIGLFPHASHAHRKQPPVCRYAFESRPRDSPSAKLLPGATPLPNRFCFKKIRIRGKIMFSFIRKTPMTNSSSPAAVRPALSPQGRALRRQRIFGRIQEGAGYAEIAAEEGLSRERLRQIIRVNEKHSGSQYDLLDHKRMQIACLAPVLRLATEGVAQGDIKSISLLLQVVDRLDRYSDSGGVLRPRRGRR